MGTDPDLPGRPRHDVSCVGRPRPLVPTEGKQLEAGETWSPNVVYQFAEPPGNDVILLIATEERIDFRPFLTGAGGRQRGATSALGPFAALFDDEAVRTRSAASFDPGSVTTHAVILTIEP